MDVIKRVGSLACHVFLRSKLQSFLLIFIMLGVGVLEALGVISLVPVIEILSNASEPSKYTIKIKSFLDMLKLGASLYSFLFLFGSIILFKSFVKLISKKLVLNLQVSYESEISTTVFKGLLGANWIFFSSLSEGRLSNILVGEVRKVGDCLYYLFDFVAVFIKFLFYSFVLFSFSVKLSVVIILLSGLVSTVPFFISKLIHRESSRRVEFTSEIHDFIFQVVNNLSQIKIFSAGDYFFNRYKGKVENYTQVHGRVRLLSDISGIFFEPLGVAQITFIIYLCFSVFEIPFAEILVILFTLRTSIPLVGQMLTYSNVIVASSASHGSVMDLIKSSIKNLEESNGENPVSFNEKIEINNVSVKYGNEVALKSLNLVINKGDFVAFVGPSGSGKSTLIRLLTGLVSPVEGDINIDCNSLASTSLEGWRSKIGFVPQAPILLKGSIAENVAFGVEEINKERLVKSLKESNIYDFVNKLNSKENSFIGDGFNLSGGQVQKIAISRALYRQAEIILMDEPTSALDSVSEVAVLETIMELRKRKTIVLVTHDLQLTKNCDKVFVLKNGSLVESGTYKDLIKSNGMFADLQQQGS